VEGIGAERAVRHGAEPRLPVDVFRGAFLLNGVVPFALRIVTAVEALRPDELANLAGLNQLRGFVPGTGGGALGTDGEALASLLDHVVDFERFVQVARHRLFAVDVLARGHRVDGDRGVPRIVSGDDDGIDVTAFEKLAVVAEEIGILQSGLFLRPIAALVEEIACGGHHDVVLSGILMDAFEVVLADAVTDTDNGDGDTVIGANDAARGRSFVLTVNGGLENARGGHGRRDGSGFFDERPTRIAGRLVCSVIHKTWFVLFQFYWLVRAKE
jgi:hypothetical protein